VTFSLVEEVDCDPDLSFLEQDYGDCGEDAAHYRAEDAARLAAYRAGEWYMIGIRARAHVYVPTGNSTVILNFVSPGLWGIESDCDESFKKEVFEEECIELRAAIGKLAAGFDEKGRQ
jgi:hypothetical protein